MSEQAYLEIAREAARSAGRMIREETKRPHTVSRKHGFDFVTEVDRRSEEIIRGIILSAFPDHGFFGEEQVSSDSRPEDQILKEAGEYLWAVDALDGTTNFIRGIPQYAVSVALVRRGQILAGAVYDPNRDELFSALRGHGAELNGRPIRISGTESLSDAILSFGFPASDMEKRRQTVQRFNLLSPLLGSLRVFNCASLLLCYTACGRIDLTFEQGIHLWDMAAGLLLIEEAGGVALDLGGHPLTVFARENLAGPEPLVRQFLAHTLSSGKKPGEADPENVR